MPPVAPLGPRLLRSELGQASVELVAVVPLVLLCAAVAWQLALAGPTPWLCANAARVAARAEGVGPDPGAAAPSAPPEPPPPHLRAARTGARAIPLRPPTPFLLK